MWGRWNLQKLLWTFQISTFILDGSKSIPTITIHKTGNKKFHFHNIFTLVSSANKPHIQVLKQARNDHHQVACYHSWPLNWMKRFKKSLNIAFFSQVCASPHWAICSQFESIWQSSSVVSNEYGACLNSTHVLTQGITFNIFLFLLFTSSTLHCHKFRLVVGLGESSGLMEKGRARWILSWRVLSLRQGPLIHKTCISLCGGGAPRVLSGGIFFMLLLWGRKFFEPSGRIWPNIVQGAFARVSYCFLFV